MAGKATQDWRNRWAMVPGIGGRFGALGVIEAIKNYCGGIGLLGLGFLFSCSGMKGNSISNSTLKGRRGPVFPKDR